MKKSVEIRKIGRKTMKKAVQDMKIKKANKVKNKLKVIVDERQDAIKHLNEYCDTDNIDPHEKKRLCVTYNQQFV